MARTLVIILAQPAIAIAIGFSALSSFEPYNHAQQWAERAGRSL
jgi:hypothetical protein